MNRALAALAALLAVGLCAVLGPSCVRPEKDELRLMIWGAPDEVTTVRDYVKLFREAHPEIEVKLQHIPDMGYREKLNMRFKGGDPPDVFYLDFADLEGVAAAGWLLPLDDLVARDKKAGKFDPDAFFPEVYERFRYRDGKLYGVVKDFATLVLYYNKDLFNKDSVPYPQRDWTWDDFLDRARRLTHPESREYGFVLETWPGELFPWIWSSGGKLVDGEPPRWVFGSETWVDKNARAIQFLADLIWKDKVAPNPSVTRDQGTKDLFMTGKVAMCTYGRWACMEFRNIHDFDWDVVEMPQKERKATTLFPVSYSIARGTKHPDAAWELVKFLTGERAQEEVADSGHAIPSMARVARSKKFFEPSALAGLGVNAEPNITSVAFAEPNPQLLVWQEVRERLRVALDPLWNGTRRDAREVLVELQPELEALVATETEHRRRARDGKD